MRILVFAVALLTIRSAVLDWNWIPSGSMVPTVVKGDMLFIHKLAYDFRIPLTPFSLETSHPRRGDISVFRSPGNSELMVKRVIGVPGDTLHMQNNILFLNGEPLPYQPVPSELFADIPDYMRPYSRFFQVSLEDRQHSIMLTPGTPALITNFPKVTIPEGNYFMMGDNRDFSLDSRMYGFVERNQFLGRATRVLFSFNPEDYFQPRVDRFFTALN